MLINATGWATEAIHELRAQPYDVLDCIGGVGHRRLCCLRGTSPSSGTSSPSRNRQTQVGVIHVGPGPQIQMTPEIEQVMLGNGGSWDFDEPRSVIDPERCLEGGWA